MRLEKHARKIMRTMKGWNTAVMREDFKDRPEAHRAELQWLVRELESIQNINNVVITKLHRAKEILGSHHADLKPGERKFWWELENLLTVEVL